MLNKQQRLYKHFKKHGFKAEDKIRVENFRQECNDSIAKAKDEYLKKLGTKLVDPNTSQKSYWKIINKIMNKCKAPKIPPIIINNEFVINCKNKALKFAEYFSQQCRPIINDSMLPNFNYITDSRLDIIRVTSNEILSLIRKLNEGKATGPDQISAHMLLICDETIVAPLKIIFENILLSGIYPEKWKLANVTSIHKKGDKQI